jgi:steroid delta-isomerase-like uncharacterized protein
MADDRDLPRRFYEEVVNTGDVDRVEEFCAPGYVEHQVLGPDMPKGIEGVKAWVKMFREAFPDLQVEVQDVIVEGDKVVARSIATGTHQGELMGVPASGNRVEVEGIDIVRLEDGKAAEHWGVTDDLGLMQQIGAIPSPA